jgi:hypothetical protein
MPLELLLSNKKTSGDAMIETRFELLIAEGLIGMGRNHLNPLES